MQPGVREAGNDGGDFVSAGDLTGVDHNEKFHQIVVDFAASRLNDIHVFTTNGLLDT